MVSIAESLNYRIFERKWRSGEVLSGSSPCMPFLSVEQKPKSQGALSSGSKPRNNRVFAYRQTKVFSFCFGMAEWLPECYRFSVSHRQESRMKATPPSKGHSFVGGKTKTITIVFRLCSLTSSLLITQNSFDISVTDLRAAGPPAELKHITQRRKRKQP